MPKGTDERYAGHLERLRRAGAADFAGQTGFKVVDVRTQQFVENLFSRSVRLDILMLEEGKQDISRYARTSLEQGKRIQNEWLV